MFGVTILGNNSAIPAFDRHPTAQIVTLNDQCILIDCGEGTQQQLNKYKIKRSKLNVILISHLHGDHYFGLVPLISSLGLLGREQDLHLFAPAPLQQIIELQLQAANTILPYKLHFHALAEEGVIFLNNKMKISCFKTKHRIDCFGFKIEENKPPRKIDKDKVLSYQIPAVYYNQLKEGKDYTTKQGEVVKNTEVTIANTSNRKYAYCADTIYNEEMLPHIENVNLLYHETTYLKDLEDRAAQRFHSTTIQAATIAKKANAKSLIIGHFSSKYEFLNEFLEETTTIFGQTQLALEGTTFRILA
jgi:ribonuclease Z